MHFYFSWGSIFSLLGIGDPASETAICAVSVRSEPADSGRVVGNPTTAQGFGSMPMPSWTAGRIR
jgi:hypothetical protein